MSSQPIEQLPVPRPVDKDALFDVRIVAVFDSNEKLLCYVREMSALEAQQAIAIIDRMSDDNPEDFAPLVAFATWKCACNGDGTALFSDSDEARVFERMPFPKQKLIGRAALRLSGITEADEEDDSPGKDFGSP